MSFKIISTINLLTIKKNIFLLLDKNDDVTLLLLLLLEAQLHIQEAGRRPYGVGLLVIGYDSNGPHLFETSPNANHYEYVGHAIGARSQSARTYIEKVAQELDEAPLEKLIKIGVNALRESLQSNSSEEVNSQNCSIAVVGEDTPLKVYDGDDVQQFVNK